MSLSARYLQIPILSHLPHSFSSHFPQSFSPRIQHISKLSLLVCLIISIFYFTLSPSHLSASNYKTFSITTSGRKTSFIQSTLATEIDGPLDNSTLAQLCASRKWTPGLIFKCEAPQDGIVNSKNVVLNCVRFAIEAGATGLIIPLLLTQEPAPNPPILVPFTHLFDLAHFTTTLHESCPQVNLIAHVNDLWDKPSTSPAVMISPNTFPSTPQIPLLHESILANPSNWTSAFNQHLNATHPRLPTAALPVLVNLSPPPLLQWPISHDSELFITNFGHLVQTAPSLRLLAASALFALSQKHNLDLNPRAGIESGKFYGAAFPPHNSEDGTPIRKKVDYGKDFLTAAAQSDFNTIYLSPPYFPDEGSIEAFSVKGEVEAFSKLAANRSIAIETAESLLGGALPAPFLDGDNGPMLIQPERKGAKGFESEWREYFSLSAEQKEAVDYEVLIRSSQFGGSWENALSWGISLRRHVIASGGSGKWNSLSGTEVGKSGKEKVGAVEREILGLEERVAKIIDFAAEKAAEAERERAKASAAAPAHPATTKAATKTGVAKTNPKTKTRPTKTVPGKPKTTTKTGKLDAGKAKLGGGKEKVSGALAGGALVEHCFRDELSSIFGPRGEGKIWILGGWP